MEYEIIIIDVQTTIPLNGGNVFPCELAVTAFTFSQGEIRSFHKFIDPGPIPLV